MPTGHSSYYPNDFPVGEGKTDYEKYLRTVELLGLQKDPADYTSPDELLFQVTHQTSELWMKLMMHDLERIMAFLSDEKIGMACRSFRQVHEIQKLLIFQVHLIASSLSIVEYGKIRTGLGQGSGMESPGFNMLLAYPPRLWESFQNVLARHNIDLPTIYNRYEENIDLHTLVECYVEYDDLFHKWRTSHLDLVTRTIGLESNSLKGIPTKVLQRGVLERFFPDLLNLRNTLTNESNLAYGGNPLES